MIYVRAAALIMSASVAFAAPPPGTDLSSPLHYWFERQHSVIGAWCCDLSDGHILSDDDWRSNGKNYEVHINGTWYTVQDSALRDPSGGPNPTGKAIAWYTVVDGMVHLYCFAPGVEY
jgi:hypothetical protein